MISREVHLCRQEATLMLTVLLQLERHIVRYPFWCNGNLAD